MRILPGVTRHTLVRESVAGITLLAIAVPLNIGYAQIAGLPATAGLYCLILPSVLYAILASSRQLVASPDAAAAALVASSLAGLAAAGSGDYLIMAAAQAIIGGVFFLACALFKLGFLANFLSEPILIGFVGGLALDILVSQIAKMLGVKIDSGSEFIEKLVQLVSGLGAVSLWSVVISVVAIVVLVGGRRLVRAVPWALIVLVASTIFVVAVGADALGVSVLGPVEGGLPAIAWPALSFAQWVQLIPSAAALTLVAMAEGLLVARQYAQRRGYTVNPNRDLLAFGAANIAAGFSGGFTVGSSTSRTAALDQIGSRTQLPSIITAVGTLLLVLFGTALLADIPSPAIGAIVGVAVLPLLGFRQLARIWKLSRVEFAVGAVCFLGTLLLGPIYGILLAFVLSLVNLALRASKPAFDRLSVNDLPGGSLLPLTPDVATTISGLLVVRFAAPLFFANASVFTESIRKAVSGAGTHGLEYLVLDCEAITDLDVTGAGAFREVREYLETQGVQLHFSRLRPELAALFDEYDLMGASQVFGTNRQAIAALER